MRILSILILLFFNTTIYSQSTEWFRKNYPIDYSDIGINNHSVIKAKVIDIDKKIIKPDYLIKIQVDTVYQGRVDSTILLVNVAMPFMDNKIYKTSLQFINSLQGKSIIMNMWKLFEFKDVDKNRISLNWTSAYPLLYWGLIDDFSYSANRNIALFLDNPSLFIVGIDDYYSDIENFIADFYEAMQPENCDLLLKLIKKYNGRVNNYTLTFLYAAAEMYISNCKCE